jgi:hypothetical protein
MLKNGITASNSQISAKYFTVIWGRNGLYAPFSVAEILLGCFFAANNSEISQTWRTGRGADVMSPMLALA